MSHAVPRSNFKLRYRFTQMQREAIFNFLRKEITLRQLGDTLGMSHQGARDCVPKFISDSLFDGEIELRDLLSS